MTIRLSGIVLLTSVLGCGVPFMGSGGDRKSECDQIAAQAIQTSSPSEARDLAARAAECYARITS